MSITIPSQSMWPLDGRLNYNAPSTTGSTGGEGILQNNYSFLTGSVLSNFTSSISYIYKHSIQSQASVKSKSGISHIITSSTSIPTSSLYINTANWDVANQAGKGPYYDNYESWLGVSKYATKEYSILPEYKISDAGLRVYNDNTLDLTSGDDYFLSLTGALYSSSIETNFYETFAHSDNNEKLLKIVTDIPNSTGKIDIDISALIKFNPYEGFYPAERTVQLATLFSSSYADKFFYSKSGTRVTSSADKKALLGKAIQPFYAPGIMFNTIKSGIAVDYPLISSSITSDRRIYTTVDTSNWVITNNRFDYRLPFEAIIYPEQYYDRAVDMNPNPSASFGYTSSLNGNFTADYYSTAVNNFLGEVEDFFVNKDNSTIEIIPNTLGLSFGGDTSKVNISQNKLGKQYSALLKLYKTTDETVRLTTNFTPFNTSSAPTPQTFEEESITMYSLPTAFGPPCGGGILNNNLSSTNSSGTIDTLNGYNAPFTPPYYDGEAWALIDFTPTRADTYTMDEIFNSSSITYLRYEFNSASINDGFGYEYGDNETKNEPHGWDNINENAMQLNASVNITATPTSWLISPKFETPILNFNPAYTGYQMNTGSVDDIPGVSMMPRGMWHQYGVKPSVDQGIFLKIGDIPESYKKYGSRSSLRVTGTVYANPLLTGSLLTDIFRFDGDKNMKLGKVKDFKDVAEAIVALPFIIKNNKREFFEIPLHYQYPEKVKFEGFVGTDRTNDPVYGPYNISAETIRLYNDCLNLINRQKTYMKKYNLPPHFDSLKYLNVPKYLMFFAEFNEALSQQDLIDLWQNILPSIGVSDSLKIKSNTISDIPIQLFNDKVKYALEPVIETGNVRKTSKDGGTVNKSDSQVVGSTESEFIQGDDDLINYTILDKIENLQWLFFKVKQNSTTLIKQSSNASANSIPLSYPNPTNIYHNWPYDQFSLIESAKIKIKYKN